jgi:hypothetical protein
MCAIHDWSGEMIHGSKPNGLSLNGLFGEIRGGDFGAYITDNLSVPKSTKYSSVTVI